MTGRTHDLAAFTLLNAIFLTSTPPPMTIATLVAALGGNFIGGLFPDIDQPTAALYNKLPAGSIIGRLVSPLLGSHRMISHSLFGLVLFGFIMLKVLASLSHIILVDMSIVWWTFMIGVVSHLAADMLTHEGVPLLFPIPWKIGIPPFAFLRMKTGGIIEKAIVFPGLLVMNAYFVYTYHAHYLSFFRQYIH